MYLQSRISEKEDMILQMSHEIQSLKLQASREANNVQGKENEIKQLKAQILDKDRLIMELQKLIAKEERTSSDLRVEIVQLKQAHFNEI